MNKRRLVLSVLAAAGFCFSIAMQSSAETQSIRPNPTLVPSNPQPAAGQGRVTRPENDLADLSLTEAQKAKIEQIRQTMKSRRDAVINDAKEDTDQKNAMLGGLQHLEIRQVLEVLTPEQLSEVRKKVMARRAAEQEQNKTHPWPAQK
jgi:Spy/CpxP family protein refolding chaperone